jgi:hypothetical protein
MVVLAAVAGLGQVYLTPPYRIYHQAHSRAEFTSRSKTSTSHFVHWRTWQVCVCARESEWPPEGRNRVLQPLRPQSPQLPPTMEHAVSLTRLLDIWVLLKFY